MEPFVHDAVVDMQDARAELDAALDEVGDSHWQRYVPYGTRTLRELLAHIAVADHVWALTAQGLLRGEADDVKPLTPDAAQAVGQRAIERARTQSVTELRDEMARRRELLLGLYDLLEPRHLALSLPAFGEHNSVRERVWRGYHDRLHAADIRRTLNITWRPPALAFHADVRAAADALVPREMLRIIFSIDSSWWEHASRLPGWTYRQLLAHIATGDWVIQHFLRSAIDGGAFGAFPDVAAGNAERTTERAHSTDHALTEEYLSMRHQTLLLYAQLKPEHLALTFEAPRDPPVTMTLRQFVEGFQQHDRGHGEDLRPAMQHATSRFA